MKRRTPSPSDIPRGKANAIPLDALSRLWGCNPRKAREIIAQFRTKIPADGLVILSDTRQKGYWLSSDPTEIQRFISQIERMSRSQFLTLRSARIVLERHEKRGQVSIEDILDA